MSNQISKNIPLSSNIRGFRYLVCQGGGMKGAGYPGVAKALEENGVLSQIEAVAGCSAGAIFATLLALGCTAKEIEDEMAVLDFRRLQDRDSIGWMEASGLPQLLKDQGLDAKQKMDLLANIPVVKQIMMLPKQIGVGLENAEDVLSLLFGNKLGIWKGDALLRLMQRLIARKTGNPNLTFKELESLTKLKPTVFKNLILVGTNLSTKEKEYYDAQHWPDMPIATAIRISASFPGAFYPHTEPILKRKGQDGQPDEYSPGVRVDGGVVENTPDIFNHPPYFTPTAAEKGNPEVLALAFKEPKKSEEVSKITSGMSLLAALYETAMSEKELRDKYGQNIVYIDTKGVETLDFEASPEKRAELVASGYDCALKTLEAILTQEKNINYATLSINELIRHKVFLLLDKEKIEQLKQVNEQIEKKQKELGFSYEELETKINIEKQKRDRLIKLYKMRKEESGSEEALKKSCQEKIEELTRVKSEQITQIKELNFMLTGLEIRKTEFQARLKLPRNKEWVENFNRQLLMLNNFKEKIKENLNKIAVFEQEKEKLLTETMKDEKRSKEVSVRMMALTTEIRLCEEQISDLRVQKEKFISGVVAGYRHLGDDFMQHYFLELSHDFDGLERTNLSLGKNRNTLPSSSDDIIHFLDQEKDICENYLKEAKAHVKKTNQDLIQFKQFYDNFEKRSRAAEQYEMLKHFQTELLHSINEKTSFISKINQYFVSDKPSLKNTIITGAFQMVACAAFLFKSAFSLLFAPATVPLFLYGLTQKMKSKSDNFGTGFVNRFLNFFGFPNLFKINQLRYLSKMTADTLRRLDKNYEKADSTEHAYLYKMFQLYFKDTNLRFEDVFPRKKEQNKKSYEQMLENYRKKLKIETTNPKNPIFKNFDSFYKAVKEKIVQSGLKAGQKEAPKRKGEQYRLWELTRERNVAQIHLEFIQSMNKKIEGVGSLTGTVLLFDPKQIIEYLNSARYLGLALPLPIQQRFKEILQEANENRNLSLEILNDYSSLADHFNVTLPKNMQTKMREIEIQNIKDEKREIEMEQALKKFYSRRAKDRKPPKPPKLSPSI